MCLPSAWLYRGMVSTTTHTRISRSAMKRPGASGSAHWIRSTLCIREQWWPVMACLTPIALLVTSRKPEVTSMTLTLPWQIHRQRWSFTRRSWPCIRSGLIQVRSGRPQRPRKETQKHPPRRSRIRFTTARLRKEPAMTQLEEHGISDAKVATVDMKLEVVVIPVSDVDRAKEFYGRLGWRLDADFAFRQRLPRRPADTARLRVFDTVWHQGYAGRPRLGAKAVPSRLRHRGCARPTRRPRCQRQRSVPPRGARRTLPARGLKRSP